MFNSLNGGKKYKFMEQITSILHPLLTLVLSFIQSPIWQTSRLRKPQPPLVKSHLKSRAVHIAAPSLQSNSSNSEQQQSQNFPALATDWPNPKSHILIADEELQRVDNMPDLAFEQYISRLLCERGYEIQKTPNSGNFGVAIIAQSYGIKYAIQAKQRSQKVSKDVVSDAVLGKLHYQCHEAMIITNSYYQNGAIGLAIPTNCILIDRDELATWIQEASSAGAYFPIQSSPATALDLLDAVATKETDMLAVVHQPTHSDVVVIAPCARDIQVA